MKSKDYITNKELYYEVIVSKAKGQCSEKLANYFVKLANKLITTKLWNPHLYQDMEQDIVLRLLESYYLFNEEKGNNPFAYFTEIAKRAAASRFNDEHKHSIAMNYDNLYL